jgi:hypothetical protein
VLEQSLHVVLLVIFRQTPDAVERFGNTEVTTHLFKRFECRLARSVYIVLDAFVLGAIPIAILLRFAESRVHQ